MAKAKHEFTGVFIPAHIWLSKELIPAEKMMLGEISALSLKSGWCTAGRKHFSEWLQCKEPNVTYYINKLERLGFIEVVRKSGFNSKMRVIAERFSGVVNTVDGLRGVVSPTDGVVNPTDGGSQSPLPEIQYKDNENNSLSPARESETDTVEAEKEKKTIAPGGGENSAAGAAARPIEISDSPKAKTPGQLEDAMKEFYRQWETEWTDGVCRRSGEWIANDGKKAQRLVSMLSDFTTHTIKNNGGGDTYGMLNAAFQKWVRNEKHATWKDKPTKSIAANPKEYTAGRPSTRAGS